MVVFLLVALPAYAKATDGQAGNSSSQHTKRKSSTIKVKHFLLVALQGIGP